MKKSLTLTILLLFVVAASALAQRKTLSATLYKEFRPSVITFTDGHKSNQPLTNVFLKNATLLYMQGQYAMEANMDNIAMVEFAGDRTFIAIENKLAYLVDSIGGNAIFCVELFDQESYERNLKNNINISSMDLGDQVSTSTIDLNNEEDYKLPVFRHYWLRYNGEFIRVHERELGRKLPREQRTMMKRVVALPDFSWQSEESLKLLLRAVSRGQEE